MRRADCTRDRLDAHSLPTGSDRDAYRHDEGGTPPRERRGHRGRRDAARASRMELSPIVAAREAAP
jgi:hypothetical protein